MPCDVDSMVERYAAEIASRRCVPNHSESVVCPSDFQNSGRLRQLVKEGNRGIVPAQIRYPKVATFPARQSSHLAKVRVAGSNPVLRSVVPARVTFSPRSSADAHAERVFVNHPLSTSNSRKMISV